MKYEKYITLIKNLEVYSAAHPKNYEFRVAGLALLGYSYIFGLMIVFISIPLLLLIGLVVAWQELARILLLVGKLVWLAVPLAVAYFAFLQGILSVFTVKVPKPEGRALTEAEAPELIAFIKESCKNLKA